MYIAVMKLRVPRGTLFLIKATVGLCVKTGLKFSLLLPTSSKISADNKIRVTPFSDQLQTDLR